MQRAAPRLRLRSRRSADKASDLAAVGGRLRHGGRCRRPTRVWNLRSSCAQRASSAGCRGGCRFRGCRPETGDGGEGHHVPEIVYPDELVPVIDGELLEVRAVLCSGDAGGQGTSSRCRSRGESDRSEVAGDLVTVLVMGAIDDLHVLLDHPAESIEQLLVRQACDLGHMADVRIDQRPNDDRPLSNATRRPVSLCRRDRDPNRDTSADAWATRRGRAAIALVTLASSCSPGGRLSEHLGHVSTHRTPCFFVAADRGTGWCHWTGSGDDDVSS